MSDRQLGAPQAPRTPSSVRPFIMSKQWASAHKSGDSVDDQFTCMVCLEFFEDGEMMYELPCAHRYHRRCVRKWVIQKRECPKCLSVLPISPTQSPTHAQPSPRSMTLIARRRWEKDDKVDRCRGCKIEFSFFKRRHHCRCCGRIFCDACCPRSSLPVVGDGFRACAECKESRSLR